jgi:hypothetical protein
MGVALSSRKKALIRCKATVKRKKRRNIMRSMLPGALVDAVLVTAQVGMADPDMVVMVIVCDGVLFEYS